MEDQIQQNFENNESNYEMPNRIEVEKIVSSMHMLKQELSKVIVGQTQLIDLMLVAILADGHILLEGVPGVAKTLVAKSLAKALSVDFKRIQFTPDLMPSDVIGTNVFNPQKAIFEFRQGPIFANFVLVDEINRAPAKTQSSLFEVMEERQISIDGTTYTMDIPFIIIATQNPLEHEGTYALPEAQLDRFLFKINVDYPNLADEVKILQNHMNQKGMHAMVQNIDVMLSKEKLHELRSIAKTVTVDEKILNYIAKVVSDTRNHPALYLGASPRASIAILNASKAYACLQSRDFVIPEDVVTVAVPALQHRISLTPEKEMEGVQTTDIIAELLKQNEIPR